MAEDLFGDLFGSSGLPRSPSPKPKPQKGVPWEAKLIDGVYYVPLSQVSDLLKANDVLPAVRKGIDARVEMQALRKKEGL